LAVRRYGFWKEVRDLILYRNPDPSKGGGVGLFFQRTM